MEFGPLSEWMNIYWGGAVAATAGCLVFGALPRLRNGPRTRDAVWLGLGLGIHLLTRPYESIFLLLSVVLFFLPALGDPSQRRRLVKAAATVALVVLPAIGLTLLQNREVTGSWTTIPYALSRYQYGVPTTFTFQPNPTPHRELTTQQRLTYEGQAEAHGEDADTPARISSAWEAARSFCASSFWRRFTWLCRPFLWPYGSTGSSGFWSPC